MDKISNASLVASVLSFRLQKIDGRLNATINRSANPSNLLLVHVISSNARRMVPKNVTS